MAAGEEMFPVAWHGYDSKHLSQLGPIGHSSLNAAADAWRTGTLQYVTGGAGSRSAIVAPLLGVERCMGVLAIEVSAGREADAPTQAATILIAAQLSTGAWWLAGRQLDATGRDCPVRASRRFFLESDRTRSATSIRTSPFRHLGGQRDLLVVARHSNLDAPAGIGLAQFSHYVPR